MQQGCCLPAGLEAGSATRAAGRAAAKDVTGGDKLDPKRTVAFVVRGGAGLAKCIQAVCAVPEAAVVNPGSSNITHEPLSSSVTLRVRDGLSVVTLISVPARTLVAPVTGKSLPLRLRTTGGCAGAAAPQDHQCLGANETRQGHRRPAASTASVPQRRLDRRDRHLRHDRHDHHRRPARQQSCARHRPCTPQRSRWA